MLIEQIGIFILFLTPLIFFHELGHFLFARLFGVRVEVFSIGFGPKVARFKRGETEYAISIIPLGGYIKMFGDDPLNADEIPESERPKAFTHKSKWARFWIVFGGPLANFILAFAIFYALVFNGEEVYRAQFGHISEQSYFAQKGFKSGDIIAKANGKRIVELTDLSLVAPKGLNSLTVVRDGKNITIPIELSLEAFGEKFKHVLALRNPMIVDKMGNNYALSFDQDSVNFKNSLESFLNKEGNFTVYIHAVSKTNEGLKANPEKQTLALEIKNGALAEKLNELSYFAEDQRISSIMMDSPADRAGLLKDDIITHIGDKRIASFEDLRLSLQEYQEGSTVSLTLFRNGKQIKTSLIPKAMQNGGEKVLTIGVYRSANLLPPERIKTDGKGFFASFGPALDKTIGSVQHIASGFTKLLTNEVSFDSIGGPIAIGKVASDSFNTGLSYFFKLMALISVNLGIINLLPIPVLDGGHILFLFFEFVNRGPLSRRKMEMAQQFGVSVLFLLIFAAIFNDINRLF